MDIALLKYTSVVLGFLWFSAMLLQSFEVLKFGKDPLPKGWVITIALGYFALIGLGLQQKFPVDNLYKVFLPTLIYIMTFNIIFAYDLYAKGTYVNRLEHLFGTLVLSSIVYVILGSLPSLDLQNKYLLIVATVILTIFLTAFSEIIELGLDKFLGEHNIGPDLWDTNLDLLTNFIAVLIFAMILLVAI